MISNGKAVGVEESLSQTTTSQQQKYKELLDFQKDYQRGTRNVFVYAPERVNTTFIGARPAILNDGLYVPNSPDLFQITHVLTSLTNRRLNNLTGFSLSISNAFQIQNPFYTDTSTGNIDTPIYFVLGYVPYSTIAGQFDPSTGGASNLFYPIFQANLGLLRWNKANLSFNYQQFNQTYNLLDLIPERPLGSLYRNFSSNPDKITQNDLDLFANQQLTLAIGLTFQTQANINDTAFISNQDTTSGFPGLAFRLSYAFNYYALLANF